MIFEIFRKYFEKIQVSSKSEKKKITVTLYEDQYSFLIISNSILLGIKNVSSVIFRVNKNTHFVFNNFISANRVVYEITFGNVVQPDNLIACVRFTIRITKATNTHSEYVTFIFFLLKQRLHERASMLR